MKNVKYFSILYDGWIKGGTHYVGLFICYNICSKVIVKGQSFYGDFSIVRLLACSPLPVIADKDDDVFVNMRYEEKAQYSEEA